MQLQLALIPHEVENSVIPQRAVDGYVNATAMCNACGKKLSHYLENKTTKEFLAALEADAGIPASALLIIQKGGNPMEQGTWVHPDVAINLGQWCSPKFAVAVSKWVREWITGKVTSTKLPYHIERYLANMSEVPHTHFSMLNELTFNLIAPLEMQGYTLPESMVPDISEGKMFSKWLRDEKGMDTSLFPTYQHRYADGRVVTARLYPIAVLEDFRHHFHSVWIPKRMIDYFRQRDDAAMKYITIAFPALFGSKTNIAK
jgi:hypothetical protein